MTHDHPADLVGRKCVAVRRIRHYRGACESASGPLEFAWSDGTHTTIDAAADWTLTISPRPWIDPFASAAPAERDALEDDVGLWVGEPLNGDPLVDVADKRVTDVAPVINEVGELAGLDVSFGTVCVILRVIDGEVETAVVTRWRPAPVDPPRSTKNE